MSNRPRCTDLSLLNLPKRPELRTAFSIDMTASATAIEDSQISSQPQLHDGINDIRDVNNTSPGAGAKLADIQVPASFKLLRDALTKSSDVVSKARRTIGQREVKKLHQDEKDDEKRSRVMHQVHHSQHEDEFAIGWQQCSESTNMQELFDLLVKQQNVCEEFLTKLENIGKELGSELREKDHEYVSALKINSQEIEQLQSCIVNEHLVLKTAFERELKLIEDSLIADKNCILGTQKDGLEVLMSKRDEAETASLKQQREIIEEHRRDLKECESKGVQEREELKQRLESNLRKLELELEETQVQNQVDGDELEYNYRALTELAENEGSVKKQKKRITKGKEERNREMKEKQLTRSKGTRENEVLETDCERIEKQAVRLREKFARFKVSDEEKFEAVVAMNAADLRKLQSELVESQDFIFGGTIGCW